MNGRIAPPGQRVINVPRGSITFKDTTKVAQCAGCTRHTTNFVMYDGGGLPENPDQRIGVALCFYNEAKIKRGSPFLVPEIGGSDPVAFGCSADYRDWILAELAKGDIKTPPADLLVQMLRRWLLEKKGRRIHLDSDDVRQHDRPAS